MGAENKTKEACKVCHPLKRLFCIVACPEVNRQLDMAGFKRTEAGPRVYGPGGTVL